MIHKNRKEERVRRAGGETGQTRGTGMGIFEKGSKKIHRDEEVQHSIWPNDTLNYIFGNKGDKSAYSAEEKYLGEYGGLQDSSENG